MRTYVRNALLWVAWQQLFEPRWTKRILREAYANMILKDLAGGESIRALHGHLKAFTDARVDENDVDDLIPSMTNDRKDRHVLAAAALSKSTTIVTYNTKDFPSAATKPHGTRARTPDTYLHDLAKTAPDFVTDGLASYAKVLKNPKPWTFAELLGKFSDPKQLPKTAAVINAHTGVEPAAPPI